MDARNLKTEDQARCTWCPHLRALKGYDGGENSSQAAVNVSRDYNGDFACMASDCSQWMWGDPKIVDTSKGPEQVDRGYCGLTIERLGGNT